MFAFCFPKSTEFIDNKRLLSQVTPMESLTNIDVNKSDPCRTYMNTPVLDTVRQSFSANDANSRTNKMHMSQDQPSLPTKPSLTATLEAIIVPCPVQNSLKYGDIFLNTASRTRTTECPPQTHLLEQLNTQELQSQGGDIYSEYLDLTRAPRTFHGRAEVRGYRF